MVEYYTVLFNNQPDDQIYKIDAISEYVYVYHNKIWWRSQYNKKYVKLFGTKITKHEVYKKLFLELL